MSGPCWGCPDRTLALIQVLLMILVSSSVCTVMRAAQLRNKASGDWEGALDGVPVYDHYKVNFDARFREPDKGNRGGGSGSSRSSDGCMHGTVPTGGEFLRQKLE
ncbi:hypothetical protein GOBAR_AA09602 [Gossypium barbadense]|uniref:Uncharacterized protein n=1 Tax=Gossypium barbadense TaxID=3634 RepID=A0A2P5Y618_GOSBA|nr:hypothetical protein GOBAR_AA09602 [Gossypium barbadense]